MKPRAFTLVEVMVASVIAFVIIAAGASLAAAMARNIKRVEEQSDLGMRAAIVTSFLHNSLDAIGYEWRVEESAGSTTTGSFGRGNCAPATGLCVGGGSTVLPLEICKSSTVAVNVCDAPATTVPDALRVIVPRDGVIDAVVVSDRSGTALGTACTAANVPATVVLKVKGITTTPWAIDDLLMVTSSGHVSIGVVKAAFAAGGSSTTERLLSVDIGSGTALANDDGSSSASCNALASLRNAHIFRVRQVVLKVDNSGAVPKLLMANRSGGSATQPTLSFADVISDVEDFGVQLDLMKLTTANVPSLCRVDVSNVFTDSAIVGGPCAGDRLRATGAVTKVRVLGVAVGLKLRSRTAGDVTPAVVKGLFDRSAETIATDTRIHRLVTTYAALPSASAF